jgi:hypothetical protein
MELVKEYSWLLLVFFAECLNMSHVGSVNNIESVFLFIAPDGGYSITHKTGCFFAYSLRNCTVNCIAPLLLPSSPQPPYTVTSTESPWLTGRHY